MSAPAPRNNAFFFAAGEVSGDMHAADLIRALRERDPSLVFYGFGGPKMFAAGLVALEDDVSHLSTVGFAEGISAAKKAIELRKLAAKSFGSTRFRAVVLTDNQGTNVMIAQEAKKAGIPVIYYSAPHVSIWGAWDAPMLSKLCDLLIPFIPADAEVYRAAGGKTLFEGHPLADRVSSYRLKTDIRETLHLPAGKPVIGIFPGSRKLEVSRLLDIFLSAAELLASETDAVFVMPVAHSMFEAAMRDAVRAHGLESRVRIIPGDPYAAMSLSDALIMSSGTATLEAALFRKPCVIAYRISGLSFFIGKMIVKKKIIGLPNILLDRVRFPELLQQDCNPRRIADETLSWLRLDKPARTALDADFDTIAEIVGKPGVINRVADAILGQF